MNENKLGEPDCKLPLLPPESSRFDRLLKGGYLLWVVVQGLILMITGNINMAYSHIFYPFCKLNDNLPEYSTRINYSYDFTEFLFYTIVPVLIYKAIVLLRPQTEPKFDE